MCKNQVDLQNKDTISKKETSTKKEEVSKIFYKTLINQTLTRQNKIAILWF